MAKVVITGASGFVAKNARKFLFEHNHQLVSISRKDFRQLKTEKKIVSKNYEGKNIQNKIKNFDILFHLVGIGKQTIDNDYQKINFEFTKKILSLCKSAKIKNIVFLSGLGVSETTPLGYFISKYKSEQEILKSGLDYTIFRPSFIIGKDDYLTQNLKHQIKQKQLLIPGSGKFTIQPISIHDVVRIFNMVITTTKFKNKILDLVGPEIITYKKYVELFSKNNNFEIKKINLEDAYYKAISSPKPPFEFDDLNLLVGNFIGNHESLKKICRMKFLSINKILESSRLP